MGMEHTSEIATHSGFSNPGRSGENSPGDCPVFPVVSEGAFNPSSTSTDLELGSLSFTSILGCIIRTVVISTACGMALFLGLRS